MYTIDTQWTPALSFDGQRFERGMTARNVRTARIATGDQVLFGQGASERGKIGRPVRRVVVVEPAQDQHGRRMYVLRFHDGAQSAPIYGAEALSVLTPA